MAVPPSGAQVSGLWQYRQRIGQPCMNTTNRMPGPSTVPKLSVEWMRPVSAIRIPPQTMRGAGVPAPQIGTDLSFYIDSWNVRAMTSFCCSRVSFTKFTA